MRTGINRTGAGHRYLRGGTAIPLLLADEESFNSNVELIRKADLTILCDMPFGTQNIKNLESAKYARKLAVIEEDDPAARDYTGGKALAMYMELRRNALVTSLVRLHEVL